MHPRPERPAETCVPLVQVTLWQGKQHLINAGHGGTLAVGTKREDPIGIGTIDISFMEMREATWRDYPNVALIGPGMTRTVDVNATNFGKWLVRDAVLAHQHAGMSMFFDVKQVLHPGA